MTIVSYGTSDLTIDAGGQSRIFNISNSATVALAGLTLTGAETTSNGGAIYQANGTLTVAQTTISGNTGAGGAGIYQNGGTLNAYASTIEGAYLKTANLNGTTLEGNSTTSGAVTVRNGLTVDGTLGIEYGTFQFSGSQTLGGTGQVILGTSSSGATLKTVGTSDLPAILTIADTMSVTSAGYYKYIQSTNGSILNYGTIKSTANWVHLETAVENHGTITSTGGTLYVDAAVTNRGTLTSDRGTLSIRTTFDIALQEKNRTNA